MDLANEHGGLVVGTGDLSEFALGWCTFNGDHMSMYHVNAGVPKTLVRHLIIWCAEAVYQRRRGGVPARYFGNARLARVAAAASEWKIAPEDRVNRRSQRPALIFPVLHRARAFASGQGVTAGGAGLAGGLRPRHDCALAGGVLPALFCEPVQAFIHARRAKSRLGGAVAAGRLADAERCAAGRVAGGIGGGRKENTQPQKTKSSANGNFLRLRVFLVVKICPCHEPHCFWIGTAR